MLAEEGDQAAYSADEPPALSARYALLIDRETGTVLLDQGSDERWYPASVTKVMTALLTIENVDLDETVTVTEEDLAEVTWDSSIAGLVPGDTLTVRDLLAGLMIPSGNDASYVLARYVGGGDWHAFVDMMNERAAELGCTDTHFVNPCGLHDDDYSTCADLALIFEEALKHPEFVEVSSAATWELPETSVAPARELKNTDVLIDPESPVYMGDTIVSSKTGSTVEGGKSLIVLAERDGRSLIGVVMGAPLEADAAGVAPNFYDMRSLLEWGFGAWTGGGRERGGRGGLGGGEPLERRRRGRRACHDVGGGDGPGRDHARGPHVRALVVGGAPGPARGRRGARRGERVAGRAGAGHGERGRGARDGLSIPAFLVWWLTSDPGPRRSRRGGRRHSARGRRRCRQLLVARTPQEARRVVPAPAGRRAQRRAGPPAAALPVARRAGGGSHLRR